MITTDNTLEETNVTCGCANSILAAAATAWELEIAYKDVELQTNSERQDTASVNSVERQSMQSGRLRVCYPYISGSFCCASA